MSSRRLLAPEDVSTAFVARTWERRRRDGARRGRCGSPQVMLVDDPLKRVDT